jgi:hypothetical protein
MKLYTTKSFRKPSKIVKTGVTRSRSTKLRYRFQPSVQDLGDFRRPFTLFDVNFFHEYLNRFGGARIQISDVVVGYHLDEFFTGLYLLFRVLPSWCFAICCDTDSRSYQNEDDRIRGILVTQNPNITCAYFCYACSRVFKNLYIVSLLLNYSHYQIGMLSKFPHMGFVCQT